MGYLERIFLGTMALFFFFILFLFGLYFDLENVWRGGVQAEEPAFALGEWVHTREAIERAARPMEVFSRSFGNSSFGVPASEGELLDLFDFLPPEGTREETLAFWRRTLLAQGVPEGPALELEVLGHDRELYTLYVLRLEEALRDDDLELAEAILEEALRAVDRKNLYVQRDLLYRQVEVRARLGRMEEASASARRLQTVLARILEIRLEARSDAEVILALDQLRQGEDKLDTPFVTNAREVEARKTELKARLLRAREEGQVSESDTRAILERIEQEGPGPWR